MNKKNNLKKKVAGSGNNQFKAERLHVIFTLFSPFDINLCTFCSFWICLLSCVQVAACLGGDKHGLEIRNQGDKDGERERSIARSKMLG